LTTLVVATLVLALAAEHLAHAQPGGPTYQRRGSDWDGHHGKGHHRPMPSYSSQTSFGSFQRPYPYHLDYYRARWGGSYAPYFGNLYGPPNFFFGSPFFGGINPFWGFGAYPYSAFGAGFGGVGGVGGVGGFGGPGGFESPGFGGGPFMEGGGGYGPMQGFYNPAMAPMGGPMGGGVMGGGAMPGAGPGY
jgi:hypothetical protein